MESELLKFLLRSFIIITANISIKTEFSNVEKHKRMLVIELPGLNEWKLPIRPAKIKKQLISIGTRPQKIGLQKPKRTWYSQQNGRVSTSPLQLTPYFLESYSTDQWWKILLFLLVCTAYSREMDTRPRRWCYLGIRVLND